MRDRPTLFFSLVFPFLFLGLFWVIGIGQSAEKPKVLFAQSATDLENVLGAARAELSGNDSLSVVSVSEAESVEQYRSGDAEVVVAASPDGGGILVTARSERSSTAAKVLAALRASGGSTPVRTVELEQTSEPFRFGVPGVLIMALSSLALFGTAAPLIKLRERGTLQLLRTTPLSPLSFLLAQAPARLAIAGGQIFAIATLCVALGYTEANNLLLALLSATLSAMLFFAFGFFIGGVVRRSEVFSAVSGGLLPVVLMVSGVLIPLSVLPEGIARVAKLIPLTYLGDVIRHDFIATPMEHSRTLSYLIMTGATALLVALSARTFSWREGSR